MRIDVISDTVCPWCYIGKRRLELALAARPDMVAEIFWHPFELHPDMPEDGVPRDEFWLEKFGDEERSAKVVENICAAGTEIGIHFTFDRMATIPNTARSHALMRWAGKIGEQTAAAEALFCAYFEEGRDIGDIDVLTDIAEGLGLPAEDVEEQIASDAALEPVRHAAAQAHALGIEGVPCYIIGQKYALIGAQDPEKFLAVFDRIAAEEGE